MRFTHWLSVISLSLLLLPTLPAANDWAHLPSSLTLGAEGTLDASAGLSGAGSGNESLNGNVLAHVGWESPSDASQPVNVSAYASVLWVEGRGPTGRFLGDYLAADNAEAYESLRLYSWWLEAGGAGWSVRAGALLADEEFAGTTSGAELVNSAFGWPAFISANTVNTGPAYYAAALGVRVALES